MRKIVAYLSLASMVLFSGVVCAQEDDPVEKRAHTENVAIHLPAVTTLLVFTVPGYNISSPDVIVNPTQTLIASDIATTVTPVALHSQAQEFNSAFSSIPTGEQATNYSDNLLKRCGSINSPPDCPPA